MNNLSSSPVTWTWFENKWWPGYGECDVIIFLTDVWKHLAINSHISVTQNTKLVWRPLDFKTNVNYWAFSFFLLLLSQQITHSSQRGKQELLYTWFLTDTHYCWTPWKFSFPFPTVFSSHNKDFDYKFNISSNVLSHFGGTLNFSHREKSKPHFGFSFPCRSFLPSTVQER